MAKEKIINKDRLSYFWGKVEPKITALTGDTETYSIAVSKWSSVAGVSPFAHKATVTASHTITNNTVVELYNSDAVTFANYGFAVASVSGQSVTIYAVEKPSAAVTLKINYKENA